jgi:hypothetical protein
MSIEVIQINCLFKVIVAFINNFLMLLIWYVEVFILVQCDSFCRTDFLNASGSDKRLCSE